MTPETIALKRATAEMIKGAGGLEEAARRCRVGKSKLSDNQSVNHPDSFVALDVVAALEPLTRERSTWPAITRELCTVNGGVFVELPQVDEPEEVDACVLDLVDRLGALSREVRISKENDGRIDGGEARLLLTRLRALDEASARLRAVLIRVAKGG